MTSEPPLTSKKVKSTKETLIICILMEMLLFGRTEINSILQKEVTRNLCYSNLLQILKVVIETSTAIRFKGVTRNLCYSNLLQILKVVIETSTAIRSKRFKGVKIQSVMLQRLQEEFQ